MFFGDFGLCMGTWFRNLVSGLGVRVLDPSFRVLRGSFWDVSLTSGLAISA